MYYEALKAHEDGLISKEQAEWLLNSHVTLGEALMHIFMTTSNDRVRDTAKTALIETGILL
jgi:hypothetical protein